MRTLGEPLTDDERAAFIAAARKRVGVPFGHHGRSDWKLDCAGLLILAMREAGRPTIDVRRYGKQPFRDGLVEALEANAGPPVDDAPRPGDVLLMRFDGDPHHVGLVAEFQGRLTLIHSHSECGRVVEHGLVEPWLSNIVAVYRP